MAQAAGQTSDSRMQALAAATTALNLYSNQKEIGDVAKALANGDVSNQNANAHESGMGPQWAATRKFWAEPTAGNEAAATQHLSLEGTRNQYLDGVPADITAQINPQNWLEDWRVMCLPGRMETQRSLVADYGRYVVQFGDIAAWLKAHQPPALMVWGRHDTFFDISEIPSWLEDLPRMEAHILDGGHLLLETHAVRAAELVQTFLDSVEKQGAGAPISPPAEED